MNETVQPGVNHRPAFRLSLLACLGLTGLALYLRLHVYHDRVVPMADGVPLLACLWYRDRRLLWAVTAALTAAAIYKIFRLLPTHQLDDPKDWVYATMLLLNIALIAAIVHLLLRFRDHIEQKNAALIESNAQLLASNEELQSQTKELTQQSEQLQLLNHEVVRREKALQTLLETSRWMQSDSPETELMDRICKVAVEITQSRACAAAVVIEDHGQMIIRGHDGFGPTGPSRKSWAVDRSFAAIMMKQEKTAYLADMTLRPDLDTPQTANGHRLRSILASPLQVNDRIIGALEVFSHEQREWTDEDFRILEWLAAQCSLLLESATLQKELDLRRREAEEASVRKTRFLAAVSHDVRTPAYAINLMAELIGRAAHDDALSDQLPQLASDLQANARSLVALVSNVLDLARFESGKLDLQECDFSLATMVETEVRQLMPLAQAKGIQLTVQPPQPPVWLHADRIKLARVIGNLVGNAIKFTEKGSVQVLCRSLPDRRAEIRVVDTGIGIPHDQLANIFDEFYQLRNTERDRTKGTGLGLTICKRLLDAIKCDLSVQSQIGQGSAFTVTIPPMLILASPADQSAIVDDSPSEDGAAGTLAGLHVLLVEDHAITRRAAAQILTSEGATVLQASSAMEALQILTHEHPQVMLLDLMLPDMDGTEVLRRVDQQRPESLRCIFVVSGDATAARLAEVQQLGADGLLAKPVDIKNLISTLRSAIPESAAANSSMTAG